MIERTDFSELLKFVLNQKW